MNFILNLIALFRPQSVDDCMAAFSKTITKLEKLSVRKTMEADRHDNKALDLEAKILRHTEAAMAADAESEHALELAEHIRNTFKIGNPA